MQYAIAIGSNRGDRRRSLSAAAAAVQASGQVRIERAATLHDTAPVGGPPGQGAFLNGAWIVATRLGPHALLHHLQTVETRLGRVRSVRNGPRTIDLDLLLTADGQVVNSAVLRLPHPALHRRSFVLAPLVEIAGEWWHPLLNCTIATCLTRWEAACPSP